jgi:D-xylose 1-dehydrogenase (NADP+, D-xylono-1,5-lactone-forming)
MTTPVNPIRWGILGAAQIAQSRLIPAMKKAQGMEAVAVASRSKDRAKEFAAANEIPLVFETYEELIASDQVDAIYIPLPISEHKKWTLRCAQVGKPVLVEKTITEKVEDALEIKQAMQKHQVLIAEALMYRYHPLIQGVKALLKSGKLGQVHLIRSSFEVNLPRTDIRFHKATGGSGLLDVGCYCVSIARFLTDEEPSRVQAFGQFGEVDEVLGGVMQFPSGIVSYFGCSLVSQFDCSFEVVGSKGRLLVDRGGIIVWPGEAFKVRVFTDAGEEVIDFPEADHYMLMLEDFCDKLRSGTIPPDSLDDAIANLSAMEKLLASAPRD